MSRRNFAIIFFAIVVAFPLFGAGYTMTPSRGPSAGGTEVLIKGEFGAWEYVVSFGSVRATKVERIADDTLKVTTPPHLPGESTVTLFEYDRFVSTGLQFRFEGGVPASAYERLLLPILMEPVRGAFGSEFVTDFTAYLAKGDSASIFGLQPECHLSACIPPNLADDATTLTTATRSLDDFGFAYNGAPGRFVYVPKAQLSNLSMNLRVFDRSRSAQNFGTELPIVRESQFTEGFTTLVLLNVPTDERFRNTLRLYADGWLDDVGIRIEAADGTPIDHAVTLRGGEDSIFEPAYASFTNFPVGVGPVRVTITIPHSPVGTPIPPPHLWAFISVTNNDTQLITTITPQP